MIQWATGSIGAIAIRHLADNPSFDVIGAFVTSSAKVGRDIGDLAGIGPLGIYATDDVDALLAMDADCVNYAPLYANIDEMCRILRAGKNIVTPVGFTYPSVRRGDDATRLEHACLEGGSSLHGSGIHPGFTGDLLALTYARLSSRIDHIVVQEVADLRNHPSAKMNFDGLGFGRDPVEAKSDPSPLIKTMDRIFEESIGLLAAGLGVVIDDFRTVFDVAIARHDVTVRSGAISAGTVAGMRFEWQGWVEGREVITFRSFWKMDDDVDPDWGYDQAKYSIIFEGEPSFKATFEPTEPGPNGDIGFWGRMWTAMSAINAIPAVVSAPPGVRTHLEMPVVQPPSLVRPKQVDQEA